MTRLKTTWLVCALVWFAAARQGWTQTNFVLPGRWVARSWGTDAGLSQNMVNALAQTPDGYLWLGTGEGLARFDGVRFTLFGFEEGLQADGVLALHVGRDGKLWIGSAGGSFGWWEDGNARMVPGMTGENSELMVYCMAEDESNRLWVGTLAGLRIWQEGHYVRVAELARLERSTIIALEEDNDGGMWIMSGNEGVFHFHNKRLTPVPYPEGIEVAAGYCLLVDRQGKLWVGMGNGRILCYAGGGWRVYSEADGVPFSYIRCMAQDAEGSIWAGSFDTGLFLLERERFTAVDPERGMSARDIQCLKSDREGNLWVGTRTGGLNRLRQSNLMVYGKGQGLENELIKSVAESADGTLWVATSGGGLCMGRPELGFSRFIPGPAARLHAHPNSVLASSDGSLWWGGPKTLLRWKDNQLDEVSRNQRWAMGPGILSLCDDTRGGVWIGNTSGDLVHFAGNQLKVMPKQPSWRAISALAMDTNGCVWVGSVGGGVWLVDPETGAARSFSAGLSSQYIRTLYRDAGGALWVGTAGGGLNRIKDGIVARFGADQGLPVRTVSQIVEDDEGALWLGCNRGIAHVKKQDLENLAFGRTALIHTRIYGVNDGMANAECSGGFSPAGLKTRSGLICISTVRGLVLIDTQKQVSASPYPKVAVEEVLVNGQLRRPEPLAEPAPHSDEIEALATQRIVMQPGDTELELRYTGISFAAPEKVGFRYKLTGLDTKWVEAGDRRAAYYHRLPAGDYTFRVIACNAEGLWNEIGATLVVTRYPHYWETRWFSVVVGIAVLAAVAVILRLVERRRYRARLLLLKTQHAIEQERVRIAQDMHDNIGGMLTQVSQLSDMGQGQAANPAAAKGHFDRIGVQARTAVQALDEIVWATNPKNDNLPRFADYICRFADEFFETSTVRCWQEVPTTLPPHLVSAEVRHNVFMAVKEAFHNIVKHSGATEMWLRLTLRGLQVQLEIEDNGLGFDTTKAKEGDGLGNMRSRMAETGGQVEVDAAQGRGVKVRFTFPVSAPLANTHT